MTDYIASLNGNDIEGDVFCGPWTDIAIVTLFSSVTFSADQWRTYSLTSVLPEDEYDYEVMFEGYIETGKTSGNAAGMHLYSGTATSTDNANSFDLRIGSIITRNASTQIAGGIAIIPIYASDRNITVRNHDSLGKSGGMTLKVRSIRRLGTNMRSSATPYVSNISINDNSGARDIGGDVTGSQWVASGLAVASSVSISASGSNNYDLSSYLPDDDYDYEVMFTVTASTGKTSGNTFSLRIGPSSTGDNAYVCRSVTRASNTNISGGNIRSVIGAARKIYVSNAASAAATVSLDAKAYRRLGTNSSTKVSSICLKSDTQVPNALVYGNPTVTNGVVSNFAQFSYLDIPNGKHDNNAEYVVKFTTGSAQGTNLQDIQHVNDFFAIEINPNTWGVTTYNWETSSDVALFTATANTTYWVKTVINGTTKTHSYSTDGTNYTQVASFTDSTIDITKSYPLRLGAHSASKSEGAPFLGSIDLNGCYINVDGQRIWNGMDYKKHYLIGGGVADGQWVMNHQTVYADATFTNGTHSYTMNNYLPEDNVQYEIATTSYGNTKATSGNTAMVWVNADNDVIGNPVLSYCITRTSKTMTDAKNAILVCVQRNGEISLTVDSTGSATTGNCGLDFIGYRRLGSNT